MPSHNSRPAILLREGWHEGRRTRKRTLANLTDWPAAQVEALRAVLKGDYQLLAPPGFSIERTRPRGQVAAVGSRPPLRSSHNFNARMGMALSSAAQWQSGDAENAMSYWSETISTRLLELQGRAPASHSSQRG